MAFELFPPGIRCWSIAGGVESRSNVACLISVKDMAVAREFWLPKDCLGHHRTIDLVATSR